MEDDVFMKMVLDKLTNIETTSEARHVRLHDRIDAIQKDTTANTVVLAKIEADIPLIKQDLFEHKEGVIQNRGRIASLEDATRDQEHAINKSVESYKNQVEPVIKHVEAMQAFPSKIWSFTINASKFLAAIVLILSSAAWLLDWF